MTEIDPGFLELPLDQLADAALGAIARCQGVSYGDIRVHRDRIQGIHVREHDLISLSESEPLGFGVRLVLDGSWGFAASSDLTESGVARAVGAAAEMARLLRPLLEERVELAPEPSHQASWVAEVELNPFQVDAERKVNFMLDVTGRCLEAGAKFAEFYCLQVQENRFFVSTEGSRLTQQRVRLHPVMEAGLVDEKGSGLVETMRSTARPVARGWEYVEAHGFPSEAEEMVGWLQEKLAAPSVDPGPYDLVIDPSNLWLTIHESVAHGTELDRALGYEANYAGTTFATPDQVGSLRYGSPRMHVTGDRLEPHGLATVGFDDEGVAAQRWDIIKDGILVGYQLNRQMAQKFRLPRSNGCAFSDSWSHLPLQRMPNVSLQPDPDRDTTLVDLFAGVEEGIYIVGDKSWSIDQQRYNFQFTGQRFYRIHKGQLAGQLRDVAYQSRTPDFWGRLEALGGISAWQLHGAFNCGKGEPGQVAPVSHGCPPALFRQVNVLNARKEGKP
ncbi:MAG TPA: TldD/PmbA family protein [Candidatus Dormibacteraeota bacterium]|nr:TldD/PmbA family protein [Candidatus Dormibacteraeota bacterium]